MATRHPARLPRPLTHMTEQSPDSGNPNNTAVAARFVELQVLRGYAASMVVIVHCIAAWRPLVESDPLSRNAYEILLIPISGRAPVILFFVLSGFVLTHSILGTRSKRQDVITFYGRRLFRIMPMAITGLLLMILAAEFGRRGVVNWNALPLSNFVDVSDRARIEDLPGALLLWDNSVNPAYWTLHVELVGSLVMPFLVLLALLSKGKKQFKILTLLAVVGLALPFVPLRPTPLSHMSSMTIFCFPLGVLAYFAFAAGFRYRAFHGWVAAAVLIFAHAVFGPGTYIGSLLGNTAVLEPIMGSQNNLALYAQHLLEGLSATVLVGTLAAGGPPRFFSSGLATFIGKISYSLYIVHLPVLVAFIGTFYLCKADLMRLAPIFVIFTCAFVVFIVSMLISWVTYNIVEQPANDLGKRFKRTSRPMLISETQPST